VYYIRKKLKKPLIELGLISGYNHTDLVGKKVTAYDESKAHVTSFANFEDKFSKSKSPVVEAGGLLYNSLEYKDKGFDNSSEPIISDKAFFGLTIASGISINIKSDYHIDLMAEYDRGLSLFNYFAINEFNLKLNIPVFSLNKRQKE